MNRLDMRQMLPSGPRSTAVPAQGGAEAAGKETQKASVPLSPVPVQDRLYITQRLVY